MPVLETAAPAYRNLTQIRLLREHNPGEALATWNQLRPGSAAITFAELPTGIAVWSQSGGVVKGRMVGESSAKVHASADRFLRLCAAHNSNPIEIAAAGRELYRWLLAPELASFGDGVVSVSADSWLESIPLGALTDDSGQFLARQFAFVEAYGPGGHLPDHERIAATDPAWA